MKKIVLSVSFFISLITLTACSGSSTESPAEQVNEPIKTSRITLVRSGKPAEALPAFTTFTWNEQYNLLLSAKNKDNENALKAYIRAQLITYLHSKGYLYQADPMQADVVIGFLFAVEDDIADSAIQDKFGLLPGQYKSTVSTVRYRKGTFLLSVLDVQLKDVYWRSALQGLVDLEKDKEDPNSEHMQAILQLMIGDFPKAGR